MAVLSCAAPGAQAARFMYSADATGNQIFGFSIGSDGTTSWVPTLPLHSQSTPSALVVGANAVTLYAALSTGARPYAIGSSSGALTAGTAMAAGSAPSAIAVSPSGSRLYVANSTGNSISRFDIDADGALSAEQSAVPTGDGTAPDGVAMTPDGRFLYVAEAGTGKIAAYSVGSTTGDLTALQPTSAYDAGTSGSAPAALAVAPSGAYLYATLKGDDKIAAWGIDGATGALTPLTDSPYHAGAAPTGIAISPDGTVLVVANSGDGTVGRYVVSSGVPIERVIDSPPVVPGARSVAISPDGKHAYVGGSSAVATFDLSSIATLTPHGSQSTGAASNGLAISPNVGPTARVNPVPAPAGTTSRFQGDPSLDSDGTVAAWRWDFGDGSTATDATATHVYAQPGTYRVSLTVTDDEGCSASFVYTGQQLLCAPSGSASWSQDIVIPPAPDTTPPAQECAHDGDDGFCGTPDRKPPAVAVLGFSDGQSISVIDAPLEIVGSITPDPSGIQSVKMRFTKAAGTVAAKKTVTKRVCRKKRIKGKKRRVCRKRKVVMKTKTKVPACLTVSGTKNYLVKYVCSKVPWVSIGGESIFRYSLPVALGTGSYTVQVVAVDGAGNADVIEKGRNDVSFKVVTTPSNSGTGAGGPTTTSQTTTSPPVDDTGSPFGR